MSKNRKRKLKHVGNSFRLLRTKPKVTETRKNDLVTKSEIENREKLYKLQEFKKNTATPIPYAICKKITKNKYDNASILLNSEAKKYQFTDEKAFYDKKCFLKWLKDMASESIPKKFQHCRRIVTKNYRLAVNDPYVNQKFQTWIKNAQEYKDMIMQEEIIITSRNTSTTLCTFKSYKTNSEFDSNRINPFQVPYPKGIFN